MSAPEPDSLVMADFGSGSGDGTGGPNGGGSSRSGGAWDDGSDAEPDEDGLPAGSDHTFADLDGSGSGQGPNEPNSNWNSKNDGGTKKPGKATRCDRLPSAFRVMLLLMMDDESSSSDYWTEPGSIC